MIRPFGESALLVDTESADRAQALAAALQREPIAGVTASIPGLRSLLVELNPLSAEVGAVREALARRLAEAGQPTVEPRLRTIPVAYGGEFGPDLPGVSALTGLSEAEVVERHGGAELRVLFDGFAPGFAYLGELPVGAPRGASRHAAHADPGGVGRNRRADERRLPGDAPGRLAGHRSHAGHPLRPAARSTRLPAARRPRPLRADRCRRVGRPRGRPRRLVTISILEPGPLTSVQDPFGRPGWRHLGVPVGGAADAWSARLANRLVGNPDDAALLEITLGNALVATDQLAWMALTGGLRAETGGIALPAHEAWQLRPGGSVRIRAADGARGYLAIGGGLVVE